MVKGTNLANLELPKTDSQKAELGKEREAAAEAHTTIISFFLKEGVIPNIAQEIARILQNAGVLDNYKDIWQAHLAALKPGQGIGLAIERLLGGQITPPGPTERVDHEPAAERPQTALDIFIDVTKMRRDKIPEKIVNWTEGWDQRGFDPGIMRDVIMHADIDGPECLFDVHFLEEEYCRYDRYSWQADCVQINYTCRGGEVLRVNYVSDGDEQVPIETLPEIAQRKLLQAAIDYHTKRYEKQQQSPPKSRPPKLSPRQQEVYTLLKEKYTIQAIADKLGITAASVGNHAREIVRSGIELRLSNGFKPDSHLG